MFVCEDLTYVNLFERYYRQLVLQGTEIKEQFISATPKQIFSMNIPHSDFPRVVIIGGGFAGVNLAKSLANKPVQVVLLDKHNYHTFQPLLYQVSSAGLEPDSIAYPLRKIIKNHKNSFFRLAEVNHIDANANVVDTSIGELGYDYLVLATENDVFIYDVDGN